MSMFTFFAFFRLVGMIEPSGLIVGCNTVAFGIMLILNERGVCRYHSGY